jgi:polynucleotide 5'-hydroxyl-kinase GRC3/NOL9
MNRTVESGKTLLVDGPASVTVISGKAEVFGSILGSSSKVVIREGKRLPFVVTEKASFQISLGENASVEEVDGNTIPPSWSKSYEELTKLDTKPAAAIVLGTVDSGKTSFCTYLVNNLLKEKRKVAVLDGDLGQSDIGPPCTVAYAFVTKPVTDLFNLELKNAFFVGATSPSAAVNKVIEGLATLKREIIEGNPDFVVINTDGWVEGEDAVNYKVRLVEELNPDIIFCIQQKDELTPLLNALGTFKKVVVDSPVAIRQRSREKRKSLRELGYIKYLKNAKVQSFPINWLKIEDDWLLGLGRASGNIRYARKIYELLGMKPLHFAELPDKICIIIGRSRWVDGDNIKRIEEFAKKKVVVTRKGEEAGLLTALHDQKRKFLGIGILHEVDFTRKTLKIYTPVSEKVSAVAFGRVKLDKNMREIPAFAEEEPLEFATVE